MNIINKAYIHSSNIVKHPTKRWRSYWWNREIEEKRNQCTIIRRQLLRNNKRKLNTTEENLEHLSVRHSELKKELKILIKKSKKELWLRLCDQVNKDVWGDGYRIVTKHLNIATERHGLSKEMTTKIIKELFPDLRLERVGRKEEHLPVVAPPFTTEELLTASQKLKPGKAPGPDGLTPEVVMMAVASVPQLLLNLMNSLLEHQTFPDAWKKSEVVLIRKRGKPAGCSSSYRPICLLDTTSKLMEHLILARLAREMDEKGVLSKNQYGFRAKRSTMDAASKILDLGANSKLVAQVTGAAQLYNANLGIKAWLLGVTE
ncbi:hypothetical protein Zmor_005992 [Zophobas morio]|uniref:Reverse transcriptase domain-containing protein n=1 Tax=Zophobas morio TaxID=2755281 RepID=A0AA38IWP4_9CUCU|nr:hypothetical protein Zmor_005992 [Zophobas morio]